jgi:D-alanine transaminase
MPRYAYVNGRYLPHAEAAVHIDDRGYQFADSVYEVIAIHGGRLVDGEGHLDRLDRSLGELRMAPPMTRGALKTVMGELVRRNGTVEGSLYLQVSRGVAPRDHAFPKRAEPSLVMTTRRARALPPRALEEGVAVVTTPDIRWKRCDIKVTALLPNVLAKQGAYEAGAFEAWLVDEKGFVTEGTSTNAWIVTADGKLVTRTADHAILNGITRRAALKLLAGEGIAFEERPFALAEARMAREAFLTSTMSHVLPVTRIDGTAVGDGRPGPITLALRRLYLDHMDGAA